jgi:hypothetical protein
MELGETEFADWSDEEFMQILKLIPSEKRTVR